jgi:hypothetical protein
MRVDYWQTISCECQWRSTMRVIINFNKWRKWGLIHYELIPEVHKTIICTSISCTVSRIQWKGTYKKFGTKQLVSPAQCICISAIDSQWVLSQAQHTGFGAFAIFPGLATNFSSFPWQKKISSERTMIQKHKGSHCKSYERIDRGIEKWFPIVLPKALWTLIKVHHSPR